MRMFTTFDDTSDAKWYECHKLPEIIKKAGYYQKWISNQGDKGVYDGVPTRLAQLCDETVFNETDASNRNGIVFDTDERIPAIVRRKNAIERHEHVVDYIHLMGSHSRYSSRYPSSREYFKASDYTDKPENHRQTLAEYDNSVLYNDSIVSEIIKIYADDEAVIIYLSDHGEDVYVSHPDFRGHGNDADPVSAAYTKQIPFMMYFTERYRERFPEKVAEIQGMANEEINNANLIYLIMDLAAVRFADPETR